MIQDVYGITPLDSCLGKLVWRPYYEGVFYSLDEEYATQQAEVKNKTMASVIFENIKAVRKVTGACDFLPMTYLTQLKFYDEEDNLITEYNPKNRSDDEHE